MARVQDKALDKAAGVPASGAAEALVTKGALSLLP